MSVDNAAGTGRPVETGDGVFLCQRGFAQKGGQTPDPWWLESELVLVVGGQSPFLCKASRGRLLMRYLLMVKATKDYEAGALPDETTLSEMARYTEELVEAGALLAAERLQPSSAGLRRALRQGKNHGNRRALPGNEGAGRRLLPDPGGIPR